MVLEFHRRFEVLANKNPRLVPHSIWDLRIGLIDEEAKEFAEAAPTGDLAKIADALGDLLYVIYGTAISYGIDLEPIFAEIHRSNMSKGDPEVLRASNGKILKSRNWTPPNLQPIIDTQVFDAKPEEQR